MDATEPHELDHVIEARPQITIFPDHETGAITISVIGMEIDAGRIESNSVSIPGENIEEVARAMLRSIGIQ